MTFPEDVMRPVSPAKVLAEIAKAVPKSCLGNMVIIGSLAAGYRFFGNKPELMVRTKDVDCLLSPHLQAILAGTEIAERLFQENWRYHKSEEWPQPGIPSTPLDQLPVIRLDPPGREDWFLELLSVPGSDGDPRDRWARVSTSKGDFGICSFRFLGLLNIDPIPTPSGLNIARPELMALANLLEHPEIRPDTMSGLIGGRRIKRSNKDLGRVLALAWLSVSEDEDTLLDWPIRWAAVLKERFPETCADLAVRCGEGLKQLLDPENQSDFEQAHHSCVYGLLASQRPSMESLRVTGNRLLQDAIGQLAIRV